MSTDGDTGSQARSRVMFDVFMLVVDRLRDIVQDHIVNEQIIKPLVDFNFNTDEYPTFKLLPITDDTRLDILQKWGDLTREGVVSKQTEDEDHIRDMVEFPKLQEGVRPTNEEARKEKDELKDKMNNPDPDSDDDEKKPEEDTPEKKFEQAGPAVIEQGLDTIEATHSELLKSILTAAQEDILKKVNKGKPVDKIKGAASMKKQLGLMLEDAYGFGSTSLKKEASFALTTNAAALEWLKKKKVVISNILDEALLNKVNLILVN